MSGCLSISRLEKNENIAIRNIFNVDLFSDRHYLHIEIDRLYLHNKL